MQTSFLSVPQFVINLMGISNTSLFSRPVILRNGSRKVIFVLNLRVEDPRPHHERTRGETPLASLSCQVSYSSFLNCEEVKQSQTSSCRTTKQMAARQRAMSTSRMPTMVGFPLCSARSRVTKRRLRFPSLKQNTNSYRAVERCSTLMIKSSISLSIPTSSFPCRTWALMKSWRTTRIWSLFPSFTRYVDGSMGQSE